MMDTQGPLDAAKETLRQTRGTLHSESARLQIQGRALSDDEQARVEGLNKATDLLDEVITILDELPGE